MKITQPIAWLTLALATGPAANALDLVKQFPDHLRSKYFSIRHERGAWDAKGFARFADGFVDLINRDFFTVNFAFPIQALVFRDRTSFQRFLHSEFHVAEPPNFGVYLEELKLFATYEDSGLGTFTHEIMHPLVERNLHARPMWALEGIPTFFEKFYGYWDGPVLRAHWGYQNPWRIRSLGDHLQQMDLERILNDPRHLTEYNECDQRLVGVFLWQQGKFKRFLKIVAGRSTLGYPSYFEAAMEMRVKQIVPLWKAYLADIEKNRLDVLMLPASQVFESREAWLRFMEFNGIPIIDSPGETSSKRRL